MGRGARARGYFSILGPGMDFYRVPMGGRNFEYMTGEDPYLGAQLVPPLIMGIQAQGVWSCAKHYVCNDEEENRTNVQILLHERTLREIYLPPFEAAVKDGHVATVMSAYNAVNGFFCSENSFLLTDILKKEWKFTGLLMSDYNAIHDGLSAALYGCDLDLPAGNFITWLFGNGCRLCMFLSKMIPPFRWMIRSVRRLHSISREKVLSCSKTCTTYSRYQRARFAPLRSSARRHKTRRRPDSAALT